MSALACHTCSLFCTGGAGGIFHCLQKNNLGVCIFALTCWVRGPIAEQVSVPTLASSNLLSGSCGRCVVFSQFYQKR